MSDGWEPRDRGMIQGWNLQSCHHLKSREGRGLDILWFNQPCLCTKTSVKTPLWQGQERSGWWTQGSAGRVGHPGRPKGTMPPPRSPHYTPPSCGLSWLASSVMNWWQEVNRILFWEKNKYCILTHITESKKHGTDEPICREGMGTQT